MFDGQWPQTVASCSTERDSVLTDLQRIRTKTSFCRGFGPPLPFLKNARIKTRFDVFVCFQLIHLQGSQPITEYRGHQGHPKLAAHTHTHTCGQQIKDETATRPCTKHMNALLVWVSETPCLVSRTLTPSHGFIFVRQGSPVTTEQLLYGAASAPSELSMAQLQKPVPAAASGMVQAPWRVRVPTGASRRGDRWGWSIGRRGGSASGVAPAVGSVRSLRGIYPKGGVFSTQTRPVWDCHRTAEKRPGVVPGHIWQSHGVFGI